MVFEGQRVTSIEHTINLTDDTILCIAAEKTIILANGYAVTQRWNGKEWVVVDDDFEWTNKFLGTYYYGRMLNFCHTDFSVIYEEGKK